jgi:predicted RNA-binding protein with PUA-like domain
MAMFILKTEPGTYSYSDLERDATTVWDGITNNAALGHLRRMAKGDDVLIYHTGEERAIVGLARVSRGPREDPKHPGKTAAGEPKFAVIDIEPVRAAGTPVPLSQLKTDKRFAGFALISQGRLSVVPVSPKLASLLRKMAAL